MPSGVSLVGLLRSAAYPVYERPPYSGPAPEIAPDLLPGTAILLFVAAYNDVSIQEGDVQEGDVTTA